MREGDTVNVFDRAVAAVAPVHAAKRAAARAALKIIDSGYGNYGANLTKKSLRGWEFYGGSAKEDIEDNIDILRQRSRDAYMGIPTASAALKTMRTNVIAGGLMPAPQLDAEFLGLTPEDAEKLQAQIVREFALWADTPVCDADRVDNFYKLQQLTFLSYAMNGDAIVLLPTKEQTGQPYSLRVRLVEADRVCSPDGFDRLVPCTVQGHDVHVSTIYRELKRGAYDRLDGGTWEVKTAYSPDIAEEKYQAHLREKGPDLKIGNDHELANYIETTILDKDCSPAAVLGFAMIEGKKFKTSLSVPTIYKYIAKGLFLNLTQEELPRHGKKKHKYKKVKKNKSASRAPAGESIEQRPEEIDEREEFGHWEGDTVYSGKGKRKTTRALLTLTERKTRKEIIIAIPNRKAETVVKALDALERKLGARRFRAIFKSITFDNGTEFAAAEELERSCVNKRLPRTKVYFCHPYSSWERGTNENTNGMIRRRFPKGTNFAAVTNAQIAQAENWINNYPRKILGYKSSEIVFRECLRELGIAA